MRGSTQAGVRCHSKPCTATTTARSITSTRSPGRSVISTGRRSRARFARSPGAPLFPCTRRPRRADGRVHAAGATYDEIFSSGRRPQPLSAHGDRRSSATLARTLRVESNSQASRWSLRVNPSSGNLHPTEAYIVCGALPGLADRRPRSTTTRRTGTPSSCDAPSTRTRGARGVGARRRRARRADVHSLARSLEVRRAGVPLLPARPRPRDRGRQSSRRRWRAGAPPCCRHGRIARSPR